MVLAGILTGISGSAFALPNITLLATGGGTIAGGGDSAIKSNLTQSTKSTCVTAISINLNAKTIRDPKAIP
jgi:L-asparaginase/Glu-tRNA(Gln) amidotransferase subunit D